MCLNFQTACSILGNLLSSLFDSKYTIVHWSNEILPKALVIIFKIATVLQCKGICLLCRTHISWLSRSKAGTDYMMVITLQMSTSLCEWEMYLSMLKFIFFFKVLIYTAIMCSFSTVIFGLIMKFKYNFQVLRLIEGNFEILKCYY